MPVSALRPCGHPGCNKLVRGGNRCDQHKQFERKYIDRNRGNSAERGYDSRWRKARQSYLADNPYCAEHLKHGRHVIAVVVDHKIPHRLSEAKQSGDDRLIAASSKLFWDQNNWQPMCKQCHDRKTFHEDGAFGRRRGG